jgi:hydroxymethylbilane synthase
MRLVLGTRGSLLARTQSNLVADFFRGHGFEVDVRIFRTSGDVFLDRPLSAMPNKGAFTKELEDALLANDIDFAVHSLKDLPTETPSSLSVLLFPKREERRDVLVGPLGRPVSVMSLPQNARVGTSSVRRAAQLRAVRPDLAVLPLRGNVDTRLRRLDSGDFDALILAGAGLERLQLACRVSEFLNETDFLPTPAQGALGVQFRSQDARVRDALFSYQSTFDMMCVRAERAFLAEFGGGCSTPLGASAVFREGKVELNAALWESSGARIWRAFAAAQDNPEALGVLVAQKLREATRSILS